MAKEDDVINITCNTVGSEDKGMVRKPVATLGHIRGRGPLRSSGRDGAECGVPANP